MTRALQQLYCHVYRLRLFTRKSLTKGLTRALPRSLNRRRINVLSSRLGGLLLGGVLVAMMALMPALPAVAQSTITWDELQAHSTHLSNPYEQLSTEQTYRLSTLYKLQEWVKENKSAPDSFEVQEIQQLEQSFVEEGLDTTELLSHVDKAKAYWRSQSQITNPDLEEQSVQLSGYVLPLNEGNRAPKDQQVGEFLLVPYVGACIHVPPPPPNQMIYIKPTATIENPGLFSSVLVTGTLRAEASSHELFQVDGSRTVEVGYAMDLDAIAPAENTVAPQIIGPWWQVLPARVSGVLTQSLASLQSQTSPRTLFLAMLLSFCYGVLHTLGPGHGKAVIVSYFVGHDGSLQRGIAMGVRIAIFHVLSAVLIAILTNTVVQQVGGSSAGSYRIIRLISYSSIALIGGWMLKRALQKQNKQQPQTISPTPLGSDAVDAVLYPSLSAQLSTSTSQSVTQSVTQSVSRTTTRQSPRQSVQQSARQFGLAACNCLSCDEGQGLGGWLSLAVGAVPCSGALLVLLYGLANDLLWPSVAMVVAISVGMAFTLAWIGAVAILGNRYSYKLAARRQHKSLNRQKRRRLGFSLAQAGQIIGASCVSLLGLGLFSLTLLTGS